MKLPAGLILLFLALTVSVRAEETAQVKTETPAVKQELVWPEIKDPQALIDFAKAEIAKLKSTNVGCLNIKLSADSPLASLQPLWGEAFVDEQALFVALDTHPQTGQGLLVVPDVKNLGNKPLLFLESAREPQLRPKVTDTAIPEIKLVLLRFSNGSGMLSWWANSIVRFKNIQNFDQEQSTSPFPLAMQMPEYPIAMLRYGLSGNAKLEFVVSAQGNINGLKITATQPEFEAAAQKAISKWRFEPGVDLETRIPVATRISLSVQFEIED